MSITGLSSYKQKRKKKNNSFVKGQQWCDYSYRRGEAKDRKILMISYEIQALQRIKSTSQHISRRDSNMTQS